MPGQWSEVPVLYCRIQLVGSHTWRKNQMPGLDSLTTHEVAVVATAAFRLENTPGGGFSFRNDTVTFRVKGQIRGEFVLTEKDSRISKGSLTKLAGTTAPDLVTLELLPQEPRTAYLHLGNLAGLILEVKTQVWERVGGQTHRGIIDEEFSIKDLFTLTLPETPREVRLDLDTAKSLLGVFSCCAADCGVRVSGVLRLTPDPPTFRIVDDSLDQNPIPHCRVRVRCPDGVEREFVTDDAGEVFIPRAGKDVYTLVEILHDSAPLSASESGRWTVDAF
ncbi:hypothetical protein D7X74_26150 [Corallococcus sp. CA047B]|uniref:hypothetical protein n=1 Tax=Corallococcus sp. CA047B TaxID=2316729 RepID=UPI000EA1111F|nr:hypothetical protein [Corallococcus sp. CA047B]RKH11060.1 hypothetical protein D7X74_26150 [Corallococcus sp. CA047B]